MSVINELMDTLVTAITEAMKATNQRAIAVPDMDERFEKMMITGGVKASEGSLEDLASLRRVSDVTVSFEAGSAVIRVSLSLGLLKLFYQRCKAWLGPLKAKDTLTVVVGKNTIDVQISVNIFKGCKTKLDFAKVVDLSDISVVFSGASKMLSPVVEVVAKFLHKEIEAVVENKLNEVLQQEMNSMDFCPMFSGMTCK